MTTRTVNCPIHGVITLTPRMCKIVDTPEFHRLKGLKQLGATHYVYPSATHTRFEHSLGVSHLARVLLSSLRERNIVSNITDELIELYQIAGLIHDIGHGPFSHLYDDEIINPEEDEEHEGRGIKIFKNMIDLYNFDFTSKQIEFIVELINPSPSNKKNWKYQIINNKMCSIDIDKIDYIQRDCYHLGFGVNQTFERLLTMCNVLPFNFGDMHELVLCWPEKLQDEIMSLFATRYRLHKQVYTHHTVKAVEDVIIKILKEIADATSLDLSTSHDEIINFPFGHHTIKNLQQRLYFRYHPKMVGEKTITICKCPDDNIQQTIETKLKIIEEMLTKSNILHSGIKKTKIGFISGNGENPLENVPYFKKGVDTAFKVKEYSSFMAPKNCQEYVYRIYLRNNDDIEKAREMWNSIMILL